MEKQKEVWLPRVSVIVPVYRVEKYIGRCVRSLFEQTLKEMEFIFVDDCSPDRSIQVVEEVINEYPERKAQVRILHHSQNRGVSFVRNTGLQAATGDYIIYCDSDDWVESRMYERMLTKALETGADIVGCDFYEEYASRSVLRRQMFPDNNQDCIGQMLEGKLHCATWNKLIRKELYERNDVVFPEGVNMWEDVSTVIPLCFYAVRIVHLPEACYHYSCDNTGSYCGQMSRSSLENLVVAISLLEKFFRKHGLYERFEKDFRYLKLTVKLNLLIGSRGRQQKEWNRLYPESAASIMSYSQISLGWRIALRFAAWNMLAVFNGLVMLSRWLHPVK